MKRTLIYTAIAAVIVGSSCSRSHTSTTESLESVDVALPTVDSVTLYKNYPGTLQAQRQVKLVARVNGYLESKPYVAGARVKQGDVLYTIESRNYRDALAQAQSNVATAQADLDYAQTRYNALAEALKSEAVSRMEVEQGRSTLEEARATLASAKAALVTAQTQLSYCTVRAPFDGHVTAGVYDVGAYVGGEGQPVELGEIFEDDVMIANFSIDDAGALATLQRNIENGNIDFGRIPVSFSDTLSHDYTAALNYLAPQVDVSTGTILLQATIANPYGELRSGMFVSLDLPTGVAPHAILVKDAALSTDQLGKYLYVVNDSNQVVYTPVTVGSQVADTLRIIEKGIAPSDRYVTKALLKVRDGMEVKPITVK